MPYSILKTIITTSLLALMTSCATADVEQLNKTSTVENSALTTALAAQPAEVQARYAARNPKETLEFFEIKPGMNVVEILPGSGWYTKILLPYLGQQGQLVGVDYPQALWPNFSWMTAERIEAKKTWVSTWTADAQNWRTDNSANVSAFQFAEMPATLKGTADAVVYFRAVHNLLRFDAEQGFLGVALKETYDVLKPGGIVGIVQHQAREDRPDAWANGTNGYIKKSFLITKMKDAGFEFIGQTDINENPRDQATEGDSVWRLPPNYDGSKDDAVKKAAMTAIGESHRMTLKFRKPS